MGEIKGCGRRRRAVVNYNDGSDDDRWAMALEEGEDINEVADRNCRLESAVGTPIPEAGGFHELYQVARLSHVLWDR